MLNNLTSEHAVEFEVVFFLFIRVLLWFYFGETEEIEKYTIAATYGKDNVQPGPSAGKYAKEPNTGNASPGIQLRISFGFMLKV